MGGGGGGNLIFSAYVGSDPASTVHPPKILEISSTPKKIFEIFATKKYPDSVYLSLEKTLKYIEITPKTSPILGWPQKNIHKIFRPKKIFFFLKTPKNIEIQNFYPPKNGPSLRMCENIRVPPPPWGLVNLISKDASLVFYLSVYPLFHYSN